MGGGVRLAYWDEEGYCKVLLAEGGKHKPSKSPPKEEQKSKKKHEKVSDPVTGEKSKKRKADVLIEKDPVIIPAKRAPSHLQFWQERHSELHGKDSDAANGPSPKAVDESDQFTYPTRSYADLKRLCCYLCSRQFKTETEVNKHERISKLHQTNLQNEQLVQLAETKLKKNGIIRPEELDHDLYRDRAKERRIIHSQPANPGAAKGQQRAKEVSAAKVATEATTERETKTANRGANLLSKMGWTEGSGLGAQGTGITAPIVAGMYVEGVGLGASGGKIGDVVEGAPGEVGGYRGFVERTKEKARGRFEALDERGGQGD